MAHFLFWKSTSGFCDSGAATLYLAIRSRPNWSVSAAAGLFMVIVFRSSLMNLASFCHSQPYQTRNDWTLAAPKHTPNWLPSGLVSFCAQSRKVVRSVGGLAGSRPAALTMSTLRYIAIG